LPDFWADVLRYYL